MGSVAFFGGTMNNTQNLIYRFAHSDDAEQLSHIYKPYVETTAVSFEYVAPDAEEFRKRHLELYEFLKSNEELISAETEMMKTVKAVLSGDTANSDDKKLTNLFEIIEGAMQ